MSGGKSGGGGDTTTTVEPWSEQQPYLKDIFGIGQDLYKNYQPQNYPGSTIAPFTPAELSAIQGAANAAYGPAPEMVAQSANAQNFLLGPALMPDTNPVLKDYVAGALTPAAWQLTTEALPSIRQGAVQAGQYGGSRQGIAEGNAIRDTMRSMLDTTSGIYNNAYNQGLQSMVQAQNMTPQVLASMFYPSQQLGAVGSAQRSMDQAFIDQYVNQWNAQQMMPWDMLGNYLGVISGNYGGTSTQEQNYSPGILDAVGTLGQLALGFAAL